MGAGAYKKGFDIPYPLGVMANVIWMRQSITIDNMQLGLKSKNQDIPLTGVDFIEFGQNTNTSVSYNFRPDIWVLPFLNVYGLFGAGNTSTEVNLVAPIQLKSVVEQSLRTTGFGVMGAGGIGPIWISVDANFTWNKPELLDEATKVNVLGVRMGHSFVFKKQPDRNINVWVGGMRVHMASETKGQIKISDAISQNVWDSKDKLVSDYYEWYNGLNPNNPVDRKKIEVADNTLTPIVEKIDEANGDAIIRYGMDKQTKQLWNMALGAQFQLNKAWQLRSEVGFIGDRKSVLVSLNYRFLGPKTKEFR
tara:strand:+ start:67249 stop:68169 length:921 start_codon:yes stop_codon:yes gene_type:complete